MTFSVRYFKSNLLKGGARPSLFQVELLFPSVAGIKQPTIKSKFLVKGATIPASTIGAYDVYFHGRAVRVAGDRTFDTWETTIINDEDFGIRIALEQWMDLIADHRLNIRRKLSKKAGENASYKQRLKLTQYTKTGVEAWHYHFLGAFPTALSTIALDWGTASEIEEYTVTWSFDRWMPGTQGHLLTTDSHQN